MPLPPGVHGNRYPPWNKVKPNQLNLIQINWSQLQPAEVKTKQLNQFSSTQPNSCQLKPTQVNSTQVK